MWNLGECLKPLSTLEKNALKPPSFPKGGEEARWDQSVDTQVAWMWKTSTTRSFWCFCSTSKSQIGNTSNQWLVAFPLFYNISHEVDTSLDTLVIFRITTQKMWWNIFFKWVFQPTHYDVYLAFLRDVCYLLVGFAPSARFVWLQFGGGVWNLKKPIDERGKSI